MALTYYEILGVKPAATQDEIKAAYRKTAKKFHSDSSDADGGNDAIFREATNAYEELKDPRKRRDYDAKLKEPVRAGGSTSGSSQSSSEYQSQQQEESPVDAYVRQERDRLARERQAQGQKSQRATTRPPASPQSQHEVSTYSRLVLPLILAFLVWYVVDHNPITRPLGGYPCDAISILLTVALYKWRTTVKVIKRFHKSKEN